MNLAKRITCSIADAGDATGFSRSKIHTLIVAGDLQTVKLGRRRLVKVESLLRLLGMEGKAKRRSPGAAYQQQSTRS